MSRILTLSLVFAIAPSVAFADPATDAVEIAMMVGQVESLADICAAAAATYEPELTRDTAALDDFYRNAGLDPGTIPSDIDQGRQDETARHDDVSWPLRCDQFTQQVASLDARIGKLRNHSSAPLAAP